MKTKFVYAALMMGAMVVACSPKADEAVEAADEEVVEAVKTAKDYVPSKAFVDSVSYLIGVNFGSFIKGYDFGDVNYAQIKKGMQDFVNAEGDMRDPEFGEQFKISPIRSTICSTAILRSVITTSSSQTRRPVRNSLRRTRMQRMSSRPKAAFSTVSLQPEQMSIPRLSTQYGFTMWERLLTERCLTRWLTMPSLCSSHSTA